MIKAFFIATIYQPLYNGLIGIMGILPFADAGVVVIVFTIIVKLILLPSSIKASLAQVQMKSIEKDLKLIKEKYKDNKEEQSKKTIEYYKEKGINPFAGIFILLIQLPIVIGLYQVFLKAGLPNIDVDLLYSFIPVPETVNMMFLGMIDIAGKSITLALLAGMSTYIQLHLAAKSASEPTSGGAMQKDFAKVMAVQMKYIFPIVVVWISYSISAALALYWVTSNIFAIGQEIYIKRKYHRTPVVV